MQPVRQRCNMCFSRGTQLLHYTSAEASGYSSRAAFHIIIVYQGGDYSTSDHEQTLPIQEGVQLMHNTKLCNGPCSQICHLHFKQESQVQEELQVTYLVCSRQCNPIHIRDGIAPELAGPQTQNYSVLPRFSCFHPVSHCLHKLG